MQEISVDNIVKTINMIIIIIITTNYLSIKILKVGLCKQVLLIT